MATAEDAASVLDQFVHDVANLPAEIAHLLEEIRAKDELIAECRQVINNRDNQIQKHIKQVGGHVKHPKEDQFMKTALASYDKAMSLQDDKVALSQKSCSLLDRQVKKLDIQIRNLINDGSLPSDVTLPTLLSDSAANLVPPLSAISTGVNTPLPVLPFSAGSSTIANAAMARFAGSAALSRTMPQAPIAGMTPYAQQRESSAGPVGDTKRRRLNANLGALPIPSSNLARTSPGAGTPKAGTPGAGGRAGSVGPRPKKTMKKVAPHQQTGPLRKKVTKFGVSKKSGGRSARTSASPSMTADSGSGDETSMLRHGHGAADEEDGLGYDEDDKNVYCTCRSLSHGNMVACDNEACRYEWFHWECVGLTKEPVGRWLCPECRKLPPSQVKVAK